MMMRVGKASESVLKRSVIKLIQNAHLGSGGAVLSEDCAIVSDTAGSRAAFTIDPAAGTEPETAARAVIRAANNVYAAGGAAGEMTLSILLPVGTEEETLRELMGSALKACEETGFVLAGGHTEVSPAVSCFVVTAAAKGAVDTSEEACREQKRTLSKTAAAAGLDLVVTGWVGLEGTALLAKREEAVLLKRYPAYLIREAAGFLKYQSIREAAQICRRQGAAMTDLSSGGIYASLWTLAERLNTGFAADLRQIPIRQETVEVCNELDINPYQLLSGGSLLAAVPDGERLVSALEEAGIPAAIIGRTTAEKARVIRNGEEIRYLDRPHEDEIHKGGYMYM